jgi:hypothetical protein
MVFPRYQAITKRQVDGSFSWWCSRNHLKRRIEVVELFHYMSSNQIQVDIDQHEKRCNT